MFEFDQYLGFIAFLSILTIGFWLMIFLLTFVVPYWLFGNLMEFLKEKRKGFYHCANCGNKLFASTAKYDSGTGWPSFSEALPGAFKTKIDYSFGMERVEYHCAKCGAHHGHVFNDGPRESGKRFCNNGLCLIFKPE